MKIAYFGYDLFAGCLEWLLSNGHELQALFTCPCDHTHAFNTRVTELAGSGQTPVCLSPVQPEQLADLQAHGCEALIVAAYPFKVPFIEGGGIPYGINIHPSLLPYGRGSWPFPGIILNQHRNAGVTLHKLADAWDAGDLILQGTFPVYPQERVESLIARSQISAVQLLSQFMDAPQARWDAAQPMDIRQHPVQKKPDLNDCMIDWEQPIDAIDRHIRAHGDFYSFSVLEGLKLLITDAVVWPQDHRFAPGTLVYRSSKELVVAARDGLVLLRNVSVLRETVAPL